MGLRHEEREEPRADLHVPLPPVEVFGKRGGRYGSHNLYENYPGDCSWRSDDIILATFFNGGVRAYDMSNPFQPKEVGHYLPEPAPGADRASSNDVTIDERGLIYLVDRIRGVDIIETSAFS